MTRYSESEEAVILGDAVLLLGNDLVQQVKSRHARLTGPSEALRGYHSWDHVLDVLQALRWAVQVTGVEGTVADTTYTIAALYHDAIYCPGADDNEDRSADLMVEEVGGEALGQAVTMAAGLIRDTANHGRLEVDRDGVSQFRAIFLDADLSSFAAPWARFLHQNELIDMEFSVAYPVDQFVSGRIKFLRGMLSKETIFLSDVFGEKLEWRARRNIQRMLARLES